ncbi:uncharacterized protein I206_100057 [Kwoniella pini CBS 10737]|uniref:Uncharacterized protein n=1 Tax=Kwoniella pini CBS 10737 TaxID=1296096 RepID=A0A1B9HSF7_9TREE|nr:uncharacterized protein I206_07872 [Kwoniella pini CBS 10737]OCF46201.1 hypothetical protein I206_07872 [Kwoniella pini CBS 10737]
MSNRNQQGIELSPWGDRGAQTRGPSSTAPTEPSWIWDKVQRIGKKVNDNPVATIALVSLAAVVPISAVGYSGCTSALNKDATVIQMLEERIEELQRERNTTQQNLEMCSNAYDESVKIAKYWANEYKNLSEICPNSTVTTTQYPPRSPSSTHPGTSDNPVTSVQVTDGTRVAEFTLYDNGQVTYTGTDVPEPIIV